MASSVDTLYQPNQLLNWMYLTLADQPLHQHGGHISPSLYSSVTNSSSSGATDLWLSDHYHHSPGLGSSGNHSLSSCSARYLASNLQSLTNGNISSMANASLTNGGGSAIPSGSFVNSNIQSLHSLSNRNTNSPLSSMINVNNLLKVNGLSNQNNCYTESWSSHQHDYNSLNS
ncbi:uncharacterized protein LOC131930130, partial [Physella acuta]|uniref:uncharacterized protein LOC131930130 n=1 Tax=Physella acuta TaxID=109671 RepID=UPI0027DC230D